MTPEPLPYDTPRHPTPTIWLHHVAQTCAVAPLVIGSAIFVMFLVTRKEAFALAGFLTILGGTCLAFVGTVCASVYLFQARRAAPDEQLLARQHGHRDLRIIVANFLIAAAMSWVGIQML